MNPARPRVDRVRSSLSKLELGVAQAEITPPVGISSNPWGKSASALSTGVHRPLNAVAMALGGERDRFIVTLDLGWIGCHECDVVRFRGRVARELGIELDDLLVNLSQTHHGPPFCIHEALREGKELVPAYIEKVISTVIEICKAARSRRSVADVTWAYGTCDLATVRDLPVGDVEAVGYNPEQIPDDTLVVGRICDSSGKCVATIINYGCHPTSLGWSSSLISPDYIGRARELVETSTGAPVLFLLGACGNMSPREQYSGDVRIADKNGEVLGHSVLATLARMLPPASDFVFSELIRSGSILALWNPERVEANSAIATRRIVVQLKHKELWTSEQMREAWAPVTASKDSLDFRIRKQFELRIDYVQETGVVNHPVWFWQLGDALLLAHAGEAYMELPRDLRHRNPGRMLLWLDLTNGPGYHYIPTRSAYERKAYQASQSLLAPGGFERLLEFLDSEIKTWR